MRLKEDKNGTFLYKIFLHIWAIPWGLYHVYSEDLGLA
jgi:hypothetical protein